MQTFPDDGILDFNWSWNVKSMFHSKDLLNIGVVFISYKCKIIDQIVSVCEDNVTQYVLSDKNHYTDSRDNDDVSTALID
jgi:hypothetical protein